MCVLSGAFWDEAGGSVPGTGRAEAGFTLETAQRGGVSGAAETGGAQRPPAGRLRSVQVSHTATSRSAGGAINAMFCG